MRNHKLLSPILLLFGLITISWGIVGHQTTAIIAQNHLSEKSKQAIKDLIGDSTLAQVSTYADEIRSYPAYKNMGPWHYINLQLGYDKRQFEKTVTELSSSNVYNALEKARRDLLDTKKPKSERIFALKLIVHFIGDLHQPMHVSRAEDKGGNTIQLNFFNKGTNLHSLWDTELVEHEGLTPEQLASKYDKSTSQQIATWQNDDVLTWIYESYQLTDELYKEVYEMKTRNIGDAYYQKHISEVHERLIKGGIRLAGFLNAVFENYQESGVATKGDQANNQSAVKEKAETQICEKVYDAKYFKSSGLTLLNLGAKYPNQKYTIVIYKEDRSKFKEAPEVYFLNKTLCVKGDIKEYRGKPQIIVRNPAQILINLSSINKSG